MRMRQNKDTKRDPHKPVQLCTAELVRKEEMQWSGNSWYNSPSFEKEQKIAPSVAFKIKWERVKTM